MLNSRVIRFVTHVGNCFAMAAPEANRRTTLVSAQTESRR